VHNKNSLKIINLQLNKNRLRSGKVSDFIFIRDMLVGAKHEK